MHSPATQAPDAHLLGLYVSERSEEAFAELVRRHQPLVRGAACRLTGGSVQAAEDVAQAVFMELARQSSRLLDHPALAGWIHTTTRRMAARLARAESRRRQRELDVVSRSSAAYCAQASTSAAIEALEYLDEALSRLGEVDRAAVLLHHLQGLSFVETGRRLGLSEDAARMRAHRAVEKLRRELASMAASTERAMQQSAPARGRGRASLAVLLGSILTAARAQAASVTLPLLQVMTSVKSKVAIAVTLLALFSTPILMFRRDNLRARAEIEAMRAQLSNATQTVSAESPPPSTEPAELARLRGEHAELLRLRDQVSQMRQRLTQLEAAPPTPPANTARQAFGTELRDLGSATPERAATSLIWAAVSGEATRIPDFLELPAEVPETDAARHYEHFSRMLGRKLKNLEFTSVQGIRPNPDGTLRLTFQFMDHETGRNDSFPFIMRQHDSGWKVVVEGGVPKDF